MSTGFERPEFLPPPEPGLLRSVGLAVLAHVVLVLALSWGLRWKQDDERIAVEAELWSATVQKAAPKPVEAPPPPPAPPKVEQPAPEPQPTVAQREAEIAIEREKQRQAEEKQREAEEKQRQAEEKARQEEQERQRVAAERKRQQEEARKQELARKAAEEKKQREEQARLKRQQEEKQQEERRAKLREDTLKRMQSMANATGAPTDTGTAQRASGPSNSYAGRIRARVKPNIVFTDDVPGNPSAEVLVRLAPDGTIVGKQVRKSSGVKTWDDAVLRALDRTAVFPRDVDGTVPSTVVLVFRPRDL